MYHVGVCVGVGWGEQSTPCVEFVEWGLPLSNWCQNQHDQPYLNMVCSVIEFLTNYPVFIL